MVVATVFTKTFRAWTPEDYAHLSYSPQERLPEDDLVFFLIEIVPTLDLSPFYASYSTDPRGAPPFSPVLLVTLLLYAYCIGVFSSRKIAKACERNLAFLAIVGNDRPDFRTISDFRLAHLDSFKNVFIEVLRLADAMGMIGLGNIAFDGSKFKADASRHKAMSYGYMTQEEERLQGEINALLAQAQETDSQEDAVPGSRRGDELPDELKRRQDRLAKIQAAKRLLEERAAAKAEAERQRRAAAEAERQRHGEKRPGPEPQPISAVPDDKDQLNFSDPELNIMPQSNQGWDCSGNAQASVDAQHQLILACFVEDTPSDKQQALPLAQATLENLEQAGIALPQEETGEAKKVPVTADTGYYSKTAAEGLEEKGFDPYLATGRQKHNQPKEGEAAQSPALAVGEGKPKKKTAETQAKEEMTAKVKSDKGKALYARRKVIVEPVFGQIKEARGFRQFSLRGLKKVNGEWRLVCLTHNLLKVWRRRCALQGN